MGVKVAILQEIYDRINTALGTGNPLATVKRVRIGSIEECRKENDLPIVNISLRSGIEVADSPNRRFTDEMEIEVALVHPKLAQANNSLFKTSDTSGALYVFEALLNVLDKTTAGVLDNTFSSNAHFLRSNRYSVDESAGVVVITTDISVRSKYFVLGGR